MAKVFFTRRIPGKAVSLIEAAGHTVEVSQKDGVLTDEELRNHLSAGHFDAVVCLLTDKINASLFDIAPSVRLYANYAVGFNNIDLSEAVKRNLTVTNTGATSTGSVAEHAMALILALAKRLIESDKFTKEGKYKGWDPSLFLGQDIKGKTLGILGAGRIGARLAEIASSGFKMKVVYYDVVRNENLEKTTGAEFKEEPDDVFRLSDFISVHTPLSESTRHLIDGRRLKLMRKEAFLINTSRGPVVDEKALTEALKEGTIRGAALDVFENEPEISKELREMTNVVLTPHTASATIEAREEMSKTVADNVIAFFDGKTPPNVVKLA